MTAVLQVLLDDETSELIDRHVAEGHANSTAALVTAAQQAYMDQLDCVDEIDAMVARADAAVAAGDFTTVSSAADSEALHARAMDRLRQKLRDWTAAD